MRNLQKCIRKNCGRRNRQTDVDIYGYDGIKEAHISERGELIATFASLEDLQEWNDSVRDAKKHRSPYYGHPSNGYSVWHPDIQLKANGLKLNENEDALYDEDEYVECYDCGSVVDKDRATYIDSEYYYVCEDCLGDYAYCEECERWHKADDLVKVYTRMYDRESHYKLVCEDCAENMGAHKCEDCGEWFDEDLVHEAPDGTYYCDDHFHDYCTYCSRCGEVLWNDDAYYDDDGDAYCQYCWDQMDHDDHHIRSYHHNPDLYKHYMPDEDRHGMLIGTEIETDSDEDNVEERAEITWEFGEGEDLIYQMHDGSLSDNGIECITQPMSKLYWDNVDFESWMKDLVDAGARSHDTDTCGLHVHLSRTWLGTDDWDEQAILVGRMRQFLADNISLVQRYARRTSERWCAYTKSYDKDTIPSTKEERLSKHKEKGKDGDRYQSINNKNSNTIEFRIFKGTLKPNTYRAAVEFCLRVVDYVRNSEENTETWEEFINYKPLPQSMITYLEQRGMQTKF